MIERPSIVEFATDPELLALTLSPAQETLLRAIYGLELSPDQLDFWHQYTGRATYPALPFREVTVVAGARAGKDSRIAAPVALYEALFGGHQARLAKGERAIIPCVAADHRGTRVLYGYLRDYLTDVPLLNGMVEDVLADELRLVDRTSIVTFPCRAAAIRGWSISAAVMDELAFWRLEGQADSDTEIQAAIRRGMAGFPAPRLVKISTPYLRSGTLWDDFRRGYAQDDPDLLVWRAPSAVMNPTLAGDQLAQARRLDPARFRREFDADWTDSLAAFLSDAILDAAVMPGRTELPASPGAAYVAAVDPSGGTGDAFAFAVAHVDADSGRVVQDIVRAWSGTRAHPLELTAVIREIGALARAYHVGRVIGDRYAGQLVPQLFRDVARLTYVASPWTRSDAYQALGLLLQSGQVELLDAVDQTRQLRSLERRMLPGGRVSVDHPRGGHDDLANATALAVVWAHRLRERDDEDEEARRPDPDAQQARRDVDRVARELEALRERACARGVSETTLAQLDTVPADYQLGVLTEILGGDSLSERLRRAGIRRRFN